MKAYYDKKKYAKFITFAFMTNEIHFEIPQQAPFAMIDKVVHCDREITRCHYTPLVTNPMVIDGFFSPEGMIEMMAQSAAARASILSGGEVRIGYIVTVRDFRCDAVVPANTQLSTELELVNEVMQFQVFQVAVFHAENRIAQAEIRIFENN